MFLPSAKFFAVLARPIMMPWIVSFLKPIHCGCNKELRIEV
jgi:hypothetical protein